MQVEPIKPMLKAPGNKRLKLKYNILLSSVAFNVNLRHYIEDDAGAYDQKDAAGFIKLQALRLRTLAKSRGTPQ